MLEFLIFVGAPLLAAAMTAYLIYRTFGRDPFPRPKGPSTAPRPEPKTRTFVGVARSQEDLVAYVNRIEPIPKSGYWYGEGMDTPEARAKYSRRLDVTVILTGDKITGYQVTKELSDSEYEKLLNESNYEAVKLALFRE